MIALATAKLPSDASAIGNANAWIREIREIEAASGAASKAAGVLATKPDDTAACAIVGRFEAFFKNRWEKALPLLASGNDANLQSLAQTELAAANDFAKQLQLADGWWAISLKERGIARSHIREHAAHWYKFALPKLTGLEKARAENHVKEGAVVRTSYMGWLDLMRKVNIDRDTISGKFTFERGVLTMSTRAKMKIPVKPEKTYAVRVEFQRPDASDAGGKTFGIILPVAETEVVLEIDPTQLGLEYVGGKRWIENETTRKGDFGGARKKHLVEITVSREAPEVRILVLIDGKQQVDWKGPSSQLTLSGDWTIQPISLGTGSWDTAITITGMAMREGGDSETH